MVMNSQREHLETLNEIRSIMERSTRFISLSGLSGVAAGICALIGAGMAFLYLDASPFQHSQHYYLTAPTVSKWGLNYLQFFFLDAILVLIAALGLGYFFTWRRVKRNRQKMWDQTSLRLTINLLIPLVAGGLFCLLLVYHGWLGLVAPSTLLFYGLALVNGSKYTLDDIRFLGLFEIALGLIAMFYIGYGLEFWAIGFGLLHIVYGIVMYYKYEKNAA
ncbi:MAG: hypothetical protein AAFW73_02870 [Bacteroidota bacterium]